MQLVFHSSFLFYLDYSFILEIKLDTTMKNTGATSLFK